MTDCRTREALFCFSSCDWHSTVKRANGIASSRACEIGLPDISQIPVGPELDALERLIDFVKRILFLRKKAEREIAIVGVAPGIGLVHAEGGGFAALGAGAEIVLRDTGHRIDHGIAQLQQLLFLRAGERIEPSSPLDSRGCR